MARFGGNAGAVYVKPVGGAFAKVLDVYDWTFETHTAMRDASIKMDTMDRFVPSHGTGNKFTAKRRSQGAASVWPAYAIDAATNGNQFVWRLDLVDANGAFVQITATGYVEQATLNAPADQAIEETFILQVDETLIVSA